ncbi:MAG: dihydropteroate synthase [Cytophagales bacterium]|nr:dihydropteroate synthase [Cytophagales bacterium]
MGILNATPDSFYASSRKITVNELLKAAEKMLNEGATFLDIGGYSSRPGTEDVSVEEETQRVIAPIEAINQEFPEAIISIDTFRSQVASRALDAGANLVNDISAGRLDESMIEMVGQRGVPFIAMHMKGTPQTMKEDTDYEDLLRDVTKYFSEVKRKCLDLGIKDLIIDPGFGFAKTIEQNYYLLKNLEHFLSLNCPILVGVSRKSMIFKLLELSANEALNGTTALNSVALFGGASILRVHDIKEAVETTKLIGYLNDSRI